MINKFISILLSITLISACATGNTARVHSTTPEPTDIYSPVEAIELAPLQTVADISTDSTTGPAPILILSSQAFVAPVDGLFFTVPVASYILAESEAMQNRANVSLITQRQMDMTRLQLVEDTWRIRLNSERERFKIIHNSDIAELNRLMGLVESSMERTHDFPWVTVFVGIGSLLLGIITGYIVEYITLH